METSIAHKAEKKAMAMATMIRISRNRNLSGSWESGVARNRSGTMTWIGSRYKNLSTPNPLPPLLHLQPLIQCIYPAWLCARSEVRDCASFHYRASHHHFALAISHAAFMTGGMRTMEMTMTMMKMMG